MTKKKKIILSIVLFVLIFAGLLVTATFTDLQVSKLLTAKSLENHTYITNHTFGASFEAFGSTPIYIMFAVAFQILFWNFVYTKTGAAQIVLGVLMQICSTVSLYIMTDDTMGYIYRHLVLTEDTSSLNKGAYIKLVYVFFAVVMELAATFAFKSFSKETIKKLLRFAVASIVAVAIPTIIINLIVKDPVGRIRFRAMNMYPENEQYGFAAFARWYEVNGQWLDKQTLSELFGSTDALKSFPSGHTAAAGAFYCLIMLIDALEIKDKKLRAFLWIFPIVVTGAVAVSRIVVGAHYFSDVLVGGTLAFGLVIISREIFICRGSNLKALKA